jgi:hypothetical protein
MKLKEPTNANYAVVVCSLDKFIDLPNCDNIKAALVCGGNSVIVSKSAQTKEIGLYFPVECQISHEFLSQNNLYRKGEWGNIDSTKSGFFELNRRVKAVKFRGNKSEGFWIPVNSLSYLGIPIEAFTEGLTFDAIGDNEICRKYIAKRNPIGQPKLRGRQPRLEDKIVEHQFRFHYDTTNLRRNIHKIQPDHWISISDKWHGTSIVISNVLVNRELKWYEKLANICGLHVNTVEYGMAYSSRRVLKEVNGETKTNLHFYKEDIWGIVANEVKDILPKGYTFYGEIVGYTPSGAEIQKGYTYGCPVGGHRLLIYRVTSVNSDGHIIELSWPQMMEFCKKYGLEPVKELWYGQAEDFLGGSSDNIQPWQEDLLAKLERVYVRDQMCEYNNLQVPAEGIVVRIDHLDQSEAFKLKNFKFLCEESAALDKDIIDIETAESF